MGKSNKKKKKDGAPGGQGSPRRSLRLNKNLRSVRLQNRNNNNAVAPRGRGGGGGRGGRGRRGRGRGGGAARPRVPPPPLEPPPFEPPPFEPPPFEPPPFEPPPEEEEEERPGFIYCGNNRLHPLWEQRGTRYACMRKGFGVGYYLLDVDQNFNMPYEPADEIRFCCSNRDLTPIQLQAGNYNRYGNLAECYRKGVGAGRRKKARENAGVNAGVNA